MTEDPLTVGVHANASDAFKIMQKYNVMHVPVTEDGVLVALVSERHVRDALPSILTLKDPLARSRCLRATRVDQIWIQRPETTTQATPLVDAIAQMRRLRAGSLPVVEGRQLVGILTAGDLIGYLSEVLAERSQ